MSNIEVKGYFIQKLLWDTRTQDRLLDPHH